MILKDLRNICERMCDRGYSNLDCQIRVNEPPSMGYSPSVPLDFAARGIDWDKNTFFLSSKEKLRHLPSYDKVEEGLSLGARWQNLMDQEKDIQHAYAELETLAILTAKYKKGNAVSVHDPDSEGQITGIISKVTVNDNGIVYKLRQMEGDIALVKQYKYTLLPEAWLTKLCKFPIRRK